MSTKGYGSVKCRKCNNILNTACCFGKYLDSLGGGEIYLDKKEKAAALNPKLAVLQHSPILVSVKAVNLWYKTLLPWNNHFHTSEACLKPL